MAEDACVLRRRQDDAAVDRTRKDAVVWTGEMDAMFTRGLYFEAMILSLRRGFWRHDREPRRDLAIFRGHDVPDFARECAEKTLAKLRGRIIIPAHDLVSLFFFDFFSASILADETDVMTGFNGDDIVLSVNKLFDTFVGAPVREVRVLASFPGARATGKGGYVARMGGSTLVCHVMKVVLDVNPELLSERSRRALRRLLPRKNKFMFSEHGITGLWCGWGTCGRRMRNGGLCARHTLSFRNAFRGASALYADVIGVIADFTW